MTYRYDLQVHSEASPCSNATPADIVAAAVGTGLDGIAVTDHDTLANVDRVRERAPSDLEVVAGVEVTTTEGHLLALDVSEPPPQSDPVTVAEAVHDDGGIAVLSHPFDALRESYDGDLAALADAVDGVETVNSRCLRPAYNRRAEAYARTHGLAATGGSDAHFPMEVGRAYTESERPVREALAANETRGVGSGRFVSGHVATKVHQFRSAWLP